MEALQYIPDPTEIIQRRIDEHIDLQADNDTGCPYVCPECRKGCNDLITISPHPDSPAMCYDCLPDFVRNVYDAYHDKK